MRTPTHVLITCLAAAGALASQLSAGPGSELVTAARSNDFAAVRALLDAGGEVNARAADGATALHWAAQWDELEAARALIEAGAAADPANRYRVTPLMLAASNGSAPMIALLIAAGSNPNAALPAGETPLMRAARTGRAEAVRTLIRHGAEVNASESWRGQTALMWAAGEGHLAAVTALIRAGAEIGAKSRGGFSALLFAVRQGHKGVARALLDAGADVNDALPKQRRRGWTTDNARAEEREVGASALEVAVSNAHFEVAALLLERGADPDAAGPGWTPLHTVSWVRKPGVGSNDPAPEGSGNMDSLAIVRKLVTHGADVNFRMTSSTSPGKHSLDTSGATPFLAAARTADAELMRLLHELGADPTIPTEKGTTPLMVAAGVGVRAPDEDAGTAEEVVEAVEVALQLGGDPNAMDSDGNTALHGAAYKHVPGAVPVLVEAGARIEVWNRKNELGWTPLRIATGVHRGMNFRFSPQTAAVIREVMQAAGVSTEVEPEAFISGATR